MSSVQCFKKSSFQLSEKFSSRKLLKFLKVVKPVLKFMRAHRRVEVTPSVCNYDIVESVQNDLNESELFQLDFKFFDSNEADENLRNEELEKRLLEKLGSDTEDDSFLHPIAPSPSFRSGPWSFPSDIDICKSGDDYVTSRQTAEQQMPVAVI